MSVNFNRDRFSIINAKNKVRLFHFYNNFLRIELFIHTIYVDKVVAQDERIYTFIVVENEAYNLKII